MCTVVWKRSDSYACSYVPSIRSEYNFWYVHNPTLLLCCNERHDVKMSWHHHCVKASWTWEEDCRFNYQTDYQMFTPPLWIQLNSQSELGISFWLSMKKFISDRTWNWLLTDYIRVQGNIAIVIFFFLLYAIIFYILTKTQFFWGCLPEFRHSQVQQILPACHTYAVFLFSLSK